MKALLSAATFGLLPSPLPYAVGLDRQLMADLGGSQPRPEGETTEAEPYEDEGPMRHQSVQGPRRPRRATADAAKAR
jgi:hypothetical protein